MEKFINELKSMNLSYDNQHGITQLDLDMVAKYTDIISDLHDENHQPQVGDLVEGAYYDGAYPYQFGIIEHIRNDGTISVCYQPMIPFVYYDESKHRLSLSVSGGPFGNHKRKEFELVKDDDERLFCRFGSCGACANGAINFKAPVRRWRIPYEWKSKTFVTEITDTTNWEEEYTIYIREDIFGNKATFKTRNQLDEFLQKYGLSMTEHSSWDTGQKWRLSHNFKNEYFWKLEDLPKDVKPILAMCNGSLVDCYIQVTDHEIITWRPNPNAKEVYKPYDYKSEEYKKYKSNFNYI